MFTCRKKTKKRRKKYMSLYGRFFKPGKKNTLRRVLDRVAGMSVLDCRAYIQGELDAMKELYKKKAKNGRLVYDKEANARHEEDHRPLLDYIDAQIEKLGKSTEGDLLVQNNMQCIKDIIARDIMSVYEPDGYGSTRYDDIYVMDVLLNDVSKNITMWPRMKWATEWNPKNAEYKKLYDKYETIGRELD